MSQDSIILLAICIMGCSLIINSFAGIIRSGHIKKIENRVSAIEIRLEQIDPNAIKVSIVK